MRLKRLPGLLAPVRIAPIRIAPIRIATIRIATICIATICAGGIARAQGPDAVAMETPPASLSPPPEPFPAPDTLPPPPVLDPGPAHLEAQRLAAAFRREVPHAVRPTAWRNATTIARAQAALAQGHVTIDRPQILLVVDRAPRVQSMSLVLALPDQPWEALGSARISSGQAGRKLYYITPTGVFQNTDAILGYRAQGTFNENHVRGNGVKGMRVWDFGWHEAVKGWLATGETGLIRLEMHATDPVSLEPRLGRPASEGCVRVSSAMNRFLDMHGIIDVDDERASTLDVRFRALLAPDRTPTPLAGDTLIVIDTDQAS